MPGIEYFLNEPVFDYLTNILQQMAERIQASENALEALAERIQDDEIVTTSSGSVASFTDGADDLPMKAVIAHIEPVQSGTGDPSPTNVRPISGWTGANVVVSPTLNAQDGTTYTISWQTEAGTIYGGTIDLVSGKLVIAGVIDIIDGSQPVADNGVQSYGGIQIKYTPLNNKKYAESAATQNSGLVCDRFSTSAPQPTGPSSVTGRNTSGNLFFNMPEGVTTAQMARQWFASNPTHIYYELADPVEYDLTGQNIPSLYGVNNVWSDTGDTDVTYVANTKLYIDSRL